MEKTPTAFETSFAPKVNDAAQPTRTRQVGNARAAAGSDFTTLGDFSTPATRRVSTAASAGARPDRRSE